MEAKNSRGQYAAPPEISYDDTVPQSEHSPRPSLQVSAHVQDPLRTQEMPSYLCPECGKGFANCSLNRHLDSSHPESSHEFFKFIVAF